MSSLVSVENRDDLTEIIQDVLNNLYVSESSTSLTKAVVHALKEEVRNVLVTDNFDKTIIVKHLNDKGWSQDKIQYFVTLFEEHKSKLLYYTIIKHNSSYAECIENFDWNIKLVLGSNELKALKYALVQLAFLTRMPNGHKENFRCELNKNMLASLIDTLESTLKSH